MLLTYEIVMLVLFLAIMGWALRTRDPINVGAILGGFLLSGFDWLWCSRGFWNATTATGLTMVPGLHIQGVTYPISICAVWAVGFGFLPLVASRYHDGIATKLGALHLPVVLAVSALIDLVIEAIGISVLGVWTYHQAPQYLILGVPWSNFWFLGGVLTASYFGLARVRRWAALPPGGSLSLSAEATWKGLLMGGSTIIVPAFLLGTVQLFWWSAMHPWIESGRPF